MRYLVVGGGVAGLAAAHSLVADHNVAGGDIAVLEASGRVGGCLRPAALAGGTLDAGPDALLTRRPEGLGLLEAVGLSDRTVRPATGAAYVALPSGLIPYPSGLVLGVPTTPDSLGDSTILTPEGRRRASLGFGLPAFRNESDVSVSELVSRRWGPEVAERLAGPLVAAVHAGRADYLSAQACAPQLFPDARPPAPPRASGGSPFMSLEGGLWQLAERLRQVLGEAGVDVRTDAAARQLSGRPTAWVVSTDTDETEAERLVLAVPAPVAAALIAPFAPDGARLLDGIEHATVAMASVLLSPGTRFPDGSGFLVADSGRADRLLTACTWFDQKWPWAARPDGRVVRLSAGRHGDARVDDLDDAELVGRLVDDLADITSQDLDVVAWTISRFPGAFPQYAVGHVDRARAIRARVAGSTSSTVAVCGNSYDGVGIPPVTASARAAAGIVSGAT